MVEFGPRSLFDLSLPDQQSNPHDVFSVRLDQRNFVLAKALKERLGFRTRNKDRTQTAMNQKRLRSRIVIHRDHLLERYSSAAAVIGPEPHNRSGKCFSVQAKDFGPYCSRNDNPGLAFNPGLLLAH